jgi:ClpP class serine protease
VPNWSDLLEEVKAAGSTHDVIRRRYLAALHELTGRNVIIYYSGWLQKPQLPATAFVVNDDDKNGFMATIHELDRSKGLDLVLHTPGGDTAATESLVDYLRSMFGTDIRAIVPQLAMSAGTMIALSCNEVVMGKHSSLGPIDPQFGGIAAHGIVEEFKRAQKEIQANPLMAHVWQPIIAKYQPTFIGECEKSMKWSEEMVDEWLKTGMFANDPDKDATAAKVVRELGDHALMKSHSRHISLTKARDIGIKVAALEDDPALQEAVLSVHHACIQSLAGTAAVKIVENQNGIGYLTVTQQMTFLSPVTGAAQQ